MKEAACFFMDSIREDVLIDEWSEKWHNKITVSHQKKRKELL